MVTNPPPKMRESQQLVFGLRLVRRIFEKSLTSRSPNQNSATIWQIFSARQTVRRKDSIQAVIRTSRRLDSFLYEAAQNFEVFLNIQK
jgi:hypothetical protein